MSTIETGQIWRPTNGEADRQVIMCRASRIYDKYPLGTILVDWAKSTSDTGRCTERSFKSWIRRSGAVVCDPVKGRSCVK